MGNAVRPQAFAICPACGRIYPVAILVCERAQCIDGDGGIERLWLVTPSPSLPGFRQWWPPEMRRCVPWKYLRRSPFEVLQEEREIVAQRIISVRMALVEMRSQNVPVAEWEETAAEMRTAIKRLAELDEEIARQQVSAAAGMRRPEARLSLNRAVH